MANVLSPRFLLRGFVVFVGISLLGFVAVLIYGNNLPAFFHALGEVHWIWIVVGLGLASMDWIGGGLRNWVVVRHVHPNPPLTGMILAGGMGAWAAYLTPFNSGAGPMTMYAMSFASTPISRRRSRRRPGLQGRFLLCRRRRLNLQSSRARQHRLHRRSLCHRLHLLLLLRSRRLRHLHRLPLL